MSYAILRLCGAGSSHWLAYSSTAYNGIYLCPRHHADLVTGFDPQPGDRVRLINDPDYYGDCVVTAREGDQIQMYQIGRPDQTLHAGVWALYRASFIGWRKGCGRS